MDTIPADVAANVLFYLTDLSELLQLRTVCRKWCHEYFESDIVWRFQLIGKLPPNKANTIGDAKSFFRSTYKTFQPICKPSYLALSNGNRTIESTADCQQWQSAILSYPVISSGVHYCEFRIDEYNTTGVGNIYKLIIGVTCAPAAGWLNLERAWLGEGGSRFSIGYAAETGSILSPSDIGMRPQAIPFGAGDRVGVAADLVQEHFIFFRNGQPIYSTQCVSREERLYPSVDTAPLYFGVSIARPGFKISVLPGAKMPPYTLPISIVAEDKPLLLENR